MMLDAVTRTRFRECCNASDSNKVSKDTMMIMRTAAAPPAV